MKKLSVGFQLGENETGTKAVNYMYTIDDDYNLYAEIELPDECSEDFGYITMKNAILKLVKENKIDVDLKFFYDGQENYLDPDASAEGPGYVSIETDDESFVKRF